MKKAGKICFVFIAVIIIIPVAWIVFSSLDKKNVLSVLPSGFSVYARTDSAWNAVNPVLDLKAADVILAEPQFSGFRSAFMQFRSSPLRSSKIVAFAASRRIDAAFYTSAGKSDYTAVVSLGFLSAATRLTRFIAPHLTIKNLAWKNDGIFPHFEYTAGTTVIYIKPVRNLLVVSGSLPMLYASFSAGNEESYTEEQSSLILAKTDKPFKIAADSRKIAELFGKDNQTAVRISSLFPENSYSAVSFGITDSGVSLSADFPFTLVNNEGGLNPAAALLLYKSETPSLFSRFTDSVRYYTLINICPLENLKEAVFSVLPADMHAEKTWKNADNACSMLFSASLRDILFSWSGTEAAAFSVSDSMDPVFALQIVDEKKREEIFDKVISSIVIQSNTSLIIDGVRVPCIELPSFLSSVLSLFGKNIPRVYYIVKDGFIYFSESPENLSTIYTAQREGRMLSKDALWSSLSGKEKTDSISMYYDLDEEVPAFLRGTSLPVKILKLYAHGCCGIRVKESTLEFTLNASSGKPADRRSVPGFPLKLEGTPSAELVSSSDNKTVFWIENKNIIKAMDCSSMAVSTVKLDDSCSIDASSFGGVWAVTDTGAVYLLNNTLTGMPGYPVFIGDTPCAPCASAENTLAVPLAAGKVCLVMENGVISTVMIPSSGEIKAKPAVFGNMFAVYEKGFTGEIYFIKNGTCINADAPLEVDGIAYGSPCLAQISGKMYTAIVTQSGRFYLWVSGETVPGFPVELGGVFYENAVCVGGSFFAVSEDAVIHRVNTDCSVLNVGIPYATARKPYITAGKIRGKENLFVCADSNILYGFNEKLELLGGFPVAGWGKPVFTDINGDRTEDCIVLSIDKKLTAWNIR